MKSILSILSIGSIILSSCSSYTINTYGSSEDDLYYSKSDARNAEPIYHEEVQVQDISPANTSSYTTPDQVNTTGNYSNYNNNNDNQSNTSSNQNYSTPQQSTVDGNGTTINNNYYGDVYDNDGYYATRIQRFHRPYGNFGYYSPAYCGFYNDPFWNPGFSLGYGYSYGYGSSWSVGYGWGIGMNYGYYDPFYSPWYNPYYSYGGWGYNNGYYSGYRNGYWDGRNDNGYWNAGGNYSGGNKNTIIRGPRPSRGGVVSTAGGRAVPSRESSPNMSDGTENVRALPPTRNMPSNTAPVITNENTRVVPNTSPNGYVPPRTPNTGTSIRNTDVAPVRTSTPSRNETPIKDIRNNSDIKNNNTSPAPIRVNPNYGGPKNNPSNEGTRSPAPIRVEPAPRRSESQQQNYNAPSRSSTPSAAPSRSSGSSGGSAPRSSGPRPR